jgi:aspartyl-tRNA(Asn)/glutamyl-tRNA(Gln) amidotransferase subunit A
MMTQHLTTLTIAEAAILMQTRQLSPVELVEAHLAAIEAQDETLKSFITVTTDLARQQAQQAEQEIRAGNYRGPLHGIPLAHKDCFDSAGIPTTGGSILFKNHVPTRNAVALQKLEEAGAILLGKLNMHEWAMSVTTNNAYYGRCINPHNHARIPGGSSGGSGAAVAAGLCMGSLGTDAGGSVRLPAALCGVVGFKPTFGRISRRGVLPLSFSLDHVGPITRTVYDAALMYQATAGYNPNDPFSQKEAIDNSIEALINSSDTFLGGKKIGLALDGFNRDGKRPDNEVVAAVRATAQRLESAGAIVKEVELPYMDESARANFTMIVTEAAYLHGQLVADYPDGFTPDVYAAFERGRTTPGTDYARARQLQVEVTRQMDLFFEEYDLLLTPTCPVPAPIHNESPEAQKARMSLVAYTAPFNFTGNPALSIPCGKTSDGLPIGIQLVGARQDDVGVLVAGYLLERLLIQEA